MKVRIIYTVEIDDDYRRAINHRYGRPGLATRTQIRDFFRDHGDDNGTIVLGDELDAMEREEAES